MVNHDTQEGQTSECLVSPWFIPLGYALILLHTNGGTPTVFYGDLYGSFGPMGKRAAGTYEPADHGRRLIPRMMLARQYYAYGAQNDYFDGADPTCVGFTRHGDQAVSGGAGLAVLMSSGYSEPVTKWMFVGEQHAGETWTDLLGEVKGYVVPINANGWGEFLAMPRSVSVWVDLEAAGRSEIEGFNL